MQNRQRCSQQAPVNVARVGLPCPYHRALNAMGALCLVAALVFPLLSWFMCGIDSLPSVFGMLGAGLVFAWVLGLERWSSRSGWVRELHGILDHCREDVPGTHQR
jgi:hypothetical protein